MKNPIWSTGCLALLLFTFVGLASAETHSPWLTAPSAAPYGQSVDIKAGGLAPEALLTLRIEGPDAIESLQNVTADAEGNLQATFSPSLAGKHTAGLYDTDGKMLASVVFGFSPP